MSANYLRFANGSDGQALVLLEIGVGYNTPGIIRFPFKRPTYLQPDVTLIRINRDAPQGAPENRDRTIPFAEDAKLVIEELAQSCWTRMRPKTKGALSSENRSRQAS